MKKFLLSFLLLFATMPLWAAGVDGATYSTIDGITCENLWILDRIHTPDQFLNIQFIKDYAIKARTAAIDVENNRVYIGYSKTIVYGESTNDYAHLVIFNFETGEYIKELPLTCDGAPISGALCANQVGIDDVGNLWVVGVYYDVSANPAQIYVVEDIETGACKNVGEWKLPARESSAGSTLR